MPDQFSQADEEFMRRALQLARREQGRVEPNPMVGCVLVRNGRIVGEGAHRRFGGPHAEVNALKESGGAAKGATAYVTLEPCCFFGKTPPCTDALISAGLSRVVAATRDPNPRVSGKGLRTLRAAGISVASGLLANEARRLIAPFDKRMKTGRPWVILKWAQSLDGVIATRAGDSKWISDEASRAHAHRERGRVDAIAVGINTLLRDDPALTCRACRPRRSATRVVFDCELRTPVSAQLVRTADQTPTILFCSRGAAKRRESLLTKAGCRVLRVSQTGGRLSLTAVLDSLGKADMTNLIVEGGGTLIGQFVDRRLADEVHVYVAPIVLGGERSIRAVRGRGVGQVAQGLKFNWTELSRIGNGWFFRGRCS